MRAAHGVGWLLRIGSMAGVLCAGAFAAIISIDPSTAATSATRSITVNGFTCADHWLPPRSGQREISVTNGGNSIVDVRLLGARNSLIYGEVEAMAPGTTRTMTAIIPPGRFRLGCTYSENATVYSPIVTVSGPAVHDAHPYQQVTYAELAPLVGEVSGRGVRWPRCPGHGHRCIACRSRCRAARCSQASLAGCASRLCPFGGRVRHLRELQRRD